MRISRPRLLLRSGLLLVAAGLAAVRALQDGRTGRSLDLEPGAALFHARLALIEWVLAALAVLTAAAALLALRQRPRRHTLHLPQGSVGDPGRTGGSSPSGPGGSGPGA